MPRKGREFSRGHAEGETREERASIAGGEEGERIQGYLSALDLHPEAPESDEMADWRAALRHGTASFFERGGAARRRLEEKKKPGRYFTFEYIDLTPHALARALVLGRLDGVQTFRSMQTEYRAQGDGVPDAGAIRVLGQADVADGAGTGERHLLRLIPKSEPLAALAGAFASPRDGRGACESAESLFNPAIGLLFLSKETLGLDGRPRESIVATGTVTLERRLPRALGKRVRSLMRGGRTPPLRRSLGEAFLEEISPDSYLRVSGLRIGALAPLAGRREDPEKITREILCKFFREYLTANPLTPGGRPIHAEKISLRTPAGALRIPWAASAPPRPCMTLSEREATLRPLLPEDLVEVAYLEDRAFEGTPHNSLMGLKNELTAAIYNHAICGRERENLSLGLFKRGRLKGYVIAYGARDSRRGIEGVFISDYAVLPDPHGTLASPRLLGRVLRSIREHADYRESEGKETFVWFDAVNRERGFYPMWKRLRTAVAQRWGLTVVEEGATNGDRVSVLMQFTSSPSWTKAEESPR